MPREEARTRTPGASLKLTPKPMLAPIRKRRGRSGRRGPSRLIAERHVEEDARHSHNGYLTLVTLLHRLGRVAKVDLGGDDQAPWGVVI
jgi:hypothetical protein